MSDYDSTFDEETLHDVFDYATNSINEPVLDYIAETEPVELEEIYGALEGELTDEEVNGIVAGLHRGHLIEYLPENDSRLSEEAVTERSLYFETTTLGEYAMQADSPEEYVSLIEEVDLVSQDWD